MWDLIRNALFARKPVLPAALLSKAKLAKQGGNLSEAENLCLQVLEAEPLNADALTLLSTLPGESLGRSGRINGVAEPFFHARQNKPRSSGTRTPLGEALNGQDQPDETLRQFQYTLSLDPRNPQLLFSVAAAFAASGKFPQAITCYREVIQRKPNSAEAYCNLGLALQETGYAAEAEAMLREAARLAPGNSEITANLRLFSSNAAPLWHFSMLNDVSRNTAFDEAIRRAVRPGDHVFEIGTGSGLLAMMAARAGAAHVTTCEIVEPIAVKARQIVMKNGYADKVSILDKSSTEVRIPDDMRAPADVMIAEIVSSELLGEGILDSFDDAKSRLLKPGATIIPSHASIIGQLAGSNELARKVSVGMAAGFNLEDFNEFSPLMVMPSELGIHLDYFSDPFPIFEFSFQDQQYPASEKRRISITATHDGLCHGVLQWIRLDLYKEIRFENSPHEPEHANEAGHWRRLLFTFPKPVTVAKGQLVHLTASHNRSNLHVVLDRVE